MALGLILAGAPAFGACKLSKIAELQVTMSGPNPMVSVKINGRDAQFIADSGAFYSSIAPADAAEYGLKTVPAPFEMRVKGIGGEADARITTVKTFTLAGVPLNNIQFIVVGSEPSGVGQLGQNVLGIADVEYDLAGGAIRLMKPKDCERRAMSYWAGAKAISVLDISAIGPLSTQTAGTVYVNGAKLRAVFDTGSGVSMLSLAAAARAGIKPGDPGVVAANSMSGVGQHAVQTWIAPFASFDIGGEEIRNTRLRIGNIGIEGIDMLLGADFFLSHRVYVANSQHRLYFTYNGGPVFNLDAKTMARDGAKSAPKTSSVLAEPGTEPTGAEGYSRRGAAFAARRDYDQAIADLDRACLMAPTEPRYFYERGLARFRNQQPLLALADFNQALKLKPDDVQTLLMRSELRLAGGDRSDAAADLDVAAQFAPKESQERLLMADRYMELGAFEPALAQYGLWIIAHPTDSRMVDALNGRCWSRALLGKDLDKALGDCNAALRWAPKGAGILDSRGLVHLRQGDLDKAIADYNAALALDPKRAWSLYGRGLAKQRKDLKADGDADIAAAIALQPKLPELVKQYGVAP